MDQLTDDPGPVEDGTTGGENHHGGTVDRHTLLIAGPRGRAIVAIAVIVLSFWIVVPNIPGSTVRDRLDGWWKPASQVGLTQDWAVFSPNPRSQSIDVRARVELADGSIRFWDVPEFDPAIGAYRAYRWHKWQERLRLDNREAFWLPTAEWIAEEFDRDGVTATRITLIRRWIDHAPLTSSGDTIDAGWNEFEFYVWERDR